MSLADIRSLVDLAVTDPANLGSSAMLDAYHKSRYADLKLRVQGITMLNRASMFDDQPLRDLRATGLSALYALPLVRKTLMQMGLGLK
jgi:2-octaprenyl-6-methoxyphenol hydroxylase